MWHVTPFDNNLLENNKNYPDLFRSKWRVTIYTHNCIHQGNYIISPEHFPYLSLLMLSYVDISSAWHDSIGQNPISMRIRANGASEIKNGP